MQKLTFFDSDGKTVLKTIEVEKGKVVDLPKVEKDGYEFLGWYATPQMNRKFDFKQTINEDTNVYGGFTKFVEDKREFYILGSGKSKLLAKSSWGKLINDEFKLEKQKSNKENIYKITIDLEKGDEFQFAINDKWQNQRGFGYLSAIEKDGVKYFENSGGLGEVNTKKANIKVAKSGKYTFTLKTHPAEDYYDTKDEHYSEETKENYNLNPYDVISWSVQ